MIGTAYAFFGAASWPMVPYVVDKRLVGTAYGIAFTMENVGSVFGPILVGLIADANTTDGVIDYYWINIFLGGAAAVAFVTTIFLLIVDLAKGGVLWAANSAERYFNMLIC